jgi:formin-binding protein 1
MVPEGCSVRLIEEDDGSGWVKVADVEGGKGLVPASYIELLGSSVDSEVTPKSSPQGSGKHGKSIPLRSRYIEL